MKSFVRKSLYVYYIITIKNSLAQSSSNIDNKSNKGKNY